MKGLLISQKDVQRVFLTLVVFGCIITSTVSSQSITVLNPVPLMNLEPCTDVVQGQQMAFSRGAMCDQDIVVVDSISNELFRIPEGTDLFYYTFTYSGEVTFLCGVGMSTVPVAAMCFNVEPNPIPTVGEWGLIILFLIMLIIGVVFIKQQSVITHASVR